MRLERATLEMTVRDMCLLWWPCDAKTIYSIDRVIIGRCHFQFRSARPVSLTDLDGQTANSTKHNWIMSTHRKVGCHKMRQIATKWRSTVVCRKMCPSESPNTTYRDKYSVKWRWIVILSLFVHFVTTNFCVSTKWYFDIYSYSHASCNSSP